MRSKKLKKDLKSIEKARTKIVSSPHYKILNHRYIQELANGLYLNKKVQQKNDCIRKLQQRLDITVFLLTCISIIAILG
jgi:hypothetical protein